VNAWPIPRTSTNFSAPSCTQDGKSRSQTQSFVLPADCGCSAALPKHPDQQRVGADPLLAEVMDQAGERLRRIEPGDAFHDKLAARGMSVYDDVLKAGEAVIEDVGGRPSWPFYCIPVFWLMVVAAAFGLTVPRNRPALIAMLLCAVSHSSMIFIISELSQHYGGLLSVPSGEMRSALAHTMTPSEQ
jgi:hypothetical protein